MAVRTDLVIETREMFAGEISGVESRKQDTDGITVTHVEITTPDGAQKIGPNEVYGKSITDPCLGWEKTERLIYDIADLL